jgi:hypothetical protein
MIREGWYVSLQFSERFYYYDFSVNIPKPEVGKHYNGKWSACIAIPTAKNSTAL